VFLLHFDKKLHRYLILTYKNREILEIISLASSTISDGIVSFYSLVYGYSGDKPIFTRSAEPIKKSPFWTSWIFNPIKCLIA
jgi:hypothetical protein